MENQNFDKKKLIEISEISDELGWQCSYCHKWFSDDYGPQIWDNDTEQCWCTERCLSMHDSENPYI